MASSLNKKCIFTKTLDGISCLINDKRIHYRKGQCRNKVYWYCSNLKCSAKLETVGEKIVFAETHSSSCFKNPEKLEKLLFKSAVKQLEQDEVSNSLTPEVNEERMKKLMMEVASDVTAQSNIPEICNEFSDVKAEINNFKRSIGNVNPNSKMSPRQYEKSILMDLIAGYDIFTQPIKERPKLWAKIAKDYNEKGVAKKTITQLRKSWMNVKLKVRKKILQHGVEVIAKLPNHEIKALDLVPDEEYYKGALEKTNKELLKNGSNFDRKKSVCEILMDDSNGASEDGDVDVEDNEEENPLAVSTADYSSMDEQISFSKDPFQIRHVQDTTKFSSAGYGDEEQPYTNSIYQEEHFYDLDEDPSLDDTPDVHIMDVPDIHITDPADFLLNPDSDVEVIPNSPITNRDLSKGGVSKRMKNSGSTFSNIDPVESSTSSELSDPSVDPLFIDPLLEAKVTGINTSEENSLFSVVEKKRPQNMGLNSENISKMQNRSKPEKTRIGRLSKKSTKKNKPTMNNNNPSRIPPRFKVLAAKTFESTKPIANSDINCIRDDKPKSKIKVCNNLFEPKSVTHTKDTANSSQLNLINFEPTAYSPIASTVNASQPITDTGNFNSPLIINPNPPSYLFTSARNGSTSAPTRGMILPGYPIDVANPPSYPIGAEPSNICTEPSSDSGVVIPTPIASKPEEYLNFSKEYIYKRMNMEQTKFEFKMENLAKERQCIQERHGAEMKVLQLKLKYVTAQYEDLLKRNRKQ